MPEYSPRNVKRENVWQYGAGDDITWPLTADARRFLYLKYAVHPRDRERGIKSRDFWQETISKFDPLFGKTVGDIGASSCYAIEKLLQRGHRGTIIGIDSEASYYDFWQSWLREKYNHPGVLLMKGDAQKLQLGDNSLDGALALSLVHHLPRPRQLFSELHRVLVPGGLGALSGRGTDNLRNAWTLAQILAQAHNAVMPAENFYAHFPYRQLKTSLIESKKFKIVGEIIQNEQVYVPATDEGWQDEASVILSYLPLMRDRRTNRQLRYGQVADFLEQVIRKDYFEPFAKLNGGYFPDTADQGVVFVENIK